MEALQRAFQTGSEHFQREEFELAIEWFEKALEIAVEQQSRETEAILRLLIGRSAFELDDIGRAREELTLAHDLFREEGNTAGQARARLELGELAFWQEQYELAQRHYRRALSLLDGVDPQGVEDVLALAHLRLGTIAFEEEELEAAQSHYRQAVDLFIQLDDSLSAANALIELATCLQIEDPAQARQFFERGMALAQQAGDDYLTSVALHGLGVLAAEEGRWHQALSYYRQALELQERCGDQEGQIFTYLALGIAEQELGHARKAHTAWKRALRLAEKEELEDVVLVVQALLESRNPDWLWS